MSFNLKLLIFPILLSFTLPLFSETRDIKGVITDAETGETLPYANVIIKGTTQGASSDQNGYFVLVNAPDSSITLEIYYIGYKTRTYQVENSEKDESIINLKLKRNLLSTKTIDVTAEEYQIWKKSDEVSKVTFSPLQIQSLPSLGEADIFRSLQLLPGISGVSDGSAGLYVRGGTPDQNLVLLDGMTIYHVDHFFGFFSAFNSEFIKDVQLYKGGYPAKYGGRLSSVVNLTGKSGNINDKKFKFGINLISANALFETPLWDWGSFVFSVRRSYSDVLQTGFYQSIYDFLSDDEGAQQGPGGGRGRFNVQEETTYPVHYFYDINSKISFTLGNTDLLALSFYSGRDNLDNSRELGGLQFQGSEREDVFGNRSTIELTDWGTYGASMNWSRRWSDRFISNANFAGTRYTSDYDRHQEYESDDGGSGLNDSTNVFRGFGFASKEENQIDDITFNIDNEWHWNSYHKLSFGFSVSQISTKYDATLSDTVSLFYRESDAVESSVYLQDKWKLLDNFNINLGLRSTYYNNSDQPYFEPRIAATYKPTDLFSIKAAWGQYHQYIHRITNEQILEGSRDFWLVADSDFKPGFAEHYIAGVAYETQDYLFEIEAYYKKLDNLIEYSRRFREFANYGGLFFFGDGYSTGIEFLAQKKFGAFNGWASYTLSKTEHTFPSFNDGEAFLASHDRTHEVKLIGTYAYEKWRFSATWVFATGQPYTSPESQYYLETLDGELYSYIHVSDKNANQLPDYHRMDASVSYIIKDPSSDWSSRKQESSWQGEIGLSVFNLYDHKNVWYREYDLNTSPILITDVSMLGITPTIFLKLSF